MPETGPKNVQLTGRDPFNDPGNFDFGQVASQADATDASHALTTIASGRPRGTRGSGIRRATLVLAPLLASAAVGLVAAQETSVADATGFDACPYKDGVLDPFEQPSVPVTHHVGGKINGLNNCVANTTPPAEGTSIGETPPATSTHPVEKTKTPTRTATPTGTPTETRTPTRTATPTGTATVTTRAETPTPGVTVTPTAPDAGSGFYRSRFNPITFVSAIAIGLGMSALAGRLTRERKPKTVLKGVN